MKSQITNLALGVSGFASTEVAPVVVDTIINDPTPIVQVVVQIIIGIATLIGLFKKKK